MRYISTRGETAPLSFTEAVITGLAPDGGLLIPEQIPDVGNYLESWRDLSFVGLAKKLLPLFIDDIPTADLNNLIERAYASFSHPDVVAFKALDEASNGDGASKADAVQVLELFHGPTLAFKDVALQLLGQLFEYILENTGQHLNILGATSGDTGSAAIAGVRGLPAVDIFIMFPEGRVSPLQELQMTTVLDDNVHCLAVEGSFDDCQGLMKSIFGDAQFKSQHRLGAVNSVNWARLLAQVVYYGYASLKFARPDPVSFFVPSGNFGNAFAGYLAKQMGFPIEKLILATNDNDILSVFFATGVYQRGEVHHTISPAMDIQIASNFERFLFYHFDEDATRLRAFMDEFAETGSARVAGKPDTGDFLATSVNEAETQATIARIYQEYGYLIDPHSAIGLAAAQRFAVSGTRICIATAHPAKFPESVNQAVGKELAQHDTLDALKLLPSRKTTIAASMDAVKEYLEEHAR